MKLAALQHRIELQGYSSRDDMFCRQGWCVCVCVYVCVCVVCVCVYVVCVCVCVYVWVL